MPSFFIYLLKANIALTVCYLAYRLGLRRLTFYVLNRFFLLFGIMFSAVFPLVDINAFFHRHERLAAGLGHYSLDWGALQQVMRPQQAFTLWDVLQYIFWAGATVMTIRLLTQLISLLRIHLHSGSAIVNGEKVRLMRGKLNPFSFFRQIYINPSLHSPEDIRSILAHEKIHVKGWHTADVMTGEVNNIFYWFNPGAWLMRAAIRENLEFITDRKILQMGMDARAYQYSLVKLSGIPYATALANNFNFSHLKQRIMMMNKKRSSRINFLRYVVLMPVIAGIILLIFTNSRGQKHAIINDTAAILNPDTIQVLKSIPKGYHFNNKGYAIEVMESSGITKVVDRSGDVFGPFDLFSFTKEQLEAFNHRFGSTGTYEGLLRLKWHATFLKSHSEVMDYFWKDKRHILILLGTGKSRIYDLTNPDDHREFIEKYGTVPPEQRLLIENPDKRVHDSVPKPTVTFLPPVVVPDSLFSSSSRDDYYARQAYYKIKKRNYAQADLLAKQSLKINPDNETARNIEGYIKAREEFDQKAKEYYSKAQQAKSRPEVKFTSPQTSKTRPDPPKLRPGVRFTPPHIVKDSVPEQASRDTGRYEGILIRGTDRQNHSHADTVRLKGVMVKGIDNQNPPLLIVNDKVVPMEKFKELSPDRIASVSVLKDEKAVTGYGDKGRNGVIIITTKDRNNAPQADKTGNLTKVAVGSPITAYGKPAETHTDEYVFKNNMTDEEISRMKGISLKKSKIKMEVTSISRDPFTKLITDISVKATDLETGSTASFSNASGSGSGILGVVSKTWDKKMKVEAFGVN